LSDMVDGVLNILYLSENDKFFGLLIFIFLLQHYDAANVHCMSRDPCFGGLSGA
jgi:hypothetical protein